MLRNRKAIYFWRFEGNEHEFKLTKHSNRKCLGLCP